MTNRTPAPSPIEAKARQLAELALAARYVELERELAQVLERDDAKAIARAFALALEDADLAAAAAIASQRLLPP